VRVRVWVCVSVCVCVCAPLSLSAPAAPAARPAFLSVAAAVVVAAAVAVVAAASVLSPPSPFLASPPSAADAVCFVAAACCGRSCCCCCCGGSVFLHLWPGGLPCACLGGFCRLLPPAELLGLPPISFSCLLSPIFSCVSPSALAGGRRGRPCSTRTFYSPSSAGPGFSRAYLLSLAGPCTYLSLRGCCAPAARSGLLALFWSMCPGKSTTAPSALCRISPPWGHTVGHRTVCMPRSAPGVSQSLLLCQSLPSTFLIRAPFLGYPLFAAGILANTAEQWVADWLSWLCIVCGGISQGRPLVEPPPGGSRHAILDQRFDRSENSDLSFADS
jgi:hypothetical protein